VAQVDLLSPTEALQYGASSDFLSQFQPRPLTVQIVAGGVLGVMSWQWQAQGDVAYSAVVTSEAGAPQPYLLVDPGYGTLTFAAGTYVTNDIYNVSTAGVVTGGTGGGIGLVSATRFDLRALTCTAVTSKAITWMQPRVVPPVVSVGPQIKQWLAALYVYDLRSRQGMTPPDAGAGDDNQRLRAVDAEKQLRAIGGSEDRPPDIVDSSQGDLGAGFPAQPIGDSLRGF
jgi:hypothetical protein